jgi:flagellar hook-basal body complex protein FliE
MTIEAIAAVGASPTTQMIAPADFIDPAVPSQDMSGVAFDSLLQNLQGLNSQIQAGSEATTQLALGQADNLHQIMINGEQTRLQFELMLAVRNKVLEAYQELMRMQV